MWAAMGGCYEKMRKHRDATKCLERAEKLKDSEGIALFKLAKLYVTMNDLEWAKECFEENLIKKGEEKCDEYEFMESHMFLANYYFKIDTNKARIHLKKLENFEGNEGKRALEMLAEIGK